MKTIKNISKGGLLGALIGGVASTRFQKPDDKMSDKVLKTAIGGLGGFLLGAFIEKKVKDRK